MRFFKNTERFGALLFGSFPPQHRKGRISKKLLFLGSLDDSALPFTAIHLFILRRNDASDPGGLYFANLNGRPCADLCKKGS